jgi:hypothetical protein
MDGCRPQSAPTHRPPATNRPLTAPASRNAVISSEAPRVRFSDAANSLLSDNLSEVSNPDFWALSAADSTSAAHLPPKSLLPSRSGVTSADHRGMTASSVTAQDIPASEKRVSFKGIHLEKAAVDDYRDQQRRMALQCVTSLDGWENLKNSLIASIQSVTNPDIVLTDHARKTVLNSMLSNFFAVLHVPSFKVEHLHLEQELHSKVPTFLLQLQKDIERRQGIENTVDLNERETKQGILGTYGKQHMIEAFISGVSLAREDEESNLIVKRAALNEEFRKLQAMRKELESSHAVLSNQRSKLNDLGIQVKSKDQRIDDLERQIRRRDDSHADQVANLLKEIHALKSNFSKATSIAHATTHGIQIALSATTKQQQHVQPSSTGTLVIESARIQAIDADQQKNLRIGQTKLLADHEKRIHELEEALFSAQAANMSDSQSHRSSLATMISWASSTLKFEEELFAVVEKIFRAESSLSNTALSVSGKQMLQPQTNEKFTSLLALTQEISKVSIEISKISTQKLSKFYKLLRFANDLLSFIDLGNLALPADLESQKQELFKENASSGGDDIMMFPEGYKVQKPMSSEDAELRRILGKERSGFRSSLLDLLLDFHRKCTEIQKHSRTNSAEKDSHRRESHDSPKLEHSKGKFKAVVLMQAHSHSSPLSSPKVQPLTPSATFEQGVMPIIIQPGIASDEQSSVAILTKQRDEYMERLGTLSTEMAQLQISMKEIQKQRAEISAKTTEEYDEMTMTILDLKRENSNLALVSKNECDALNAKIFEVMQERDRLRDELGRVANAAVIDENTLDQVDDLHKQEKAPLHHQRSSECAGIHLLSRQQYDLDASSTTQTQKTAFDACCQTIEDCIKSSKLTQTEWRSSAGTRADSSSEINSNGKMEQPTFKMREDVQLPSSAKIQPSESIAPGASQMIFDATYRNVQTNIAQQRLSSVFDEFDESGHKDTHVPFCVPKIDLSNAFLQSVGEAQAHHFQQNGSYLPRFHKIAIKSKVEQNGASSAFSQARMTKSDESLMSAIAPLVASSGGVKSKIQRNAVSVLQIPSTFEVPASHFNQRPYTSRPSTSNHLSLFVGPDVHPETDRPSNRVLCVKPHRPTSTRSADGNQSKRNAKLMREGLMLPAARVLPSPTNQRNTQHCTPQVSKAPPNHFDGHNVDESPGVGTRSSILNEYLQDISVGQAS